MSATIYLEGGGDTNQLKVQCREGFRKLFQKCGYEKHMPKLVACGGREAAFERFVHAFSSKNDRDFVALLVDSEDPMLDIEKTWEHLKQRDNWDKPAEATDEHALLMTTCMETWIICAQETLKDHYDKHFQENALPTLTDMEQRTREFIQDALVKATSKCKNAYKKGKRSFEVLGKISPSTIEQYLPSFERVRRILDQFL